MPIVKYRDGNKVLEPTIPRSFTDMLDTFFDNMVGQNLESSTFQPGVDITEHDDKFELEVALPGMKKDEINIELDDNVLTISGERKMEEEKKEKKYHLVESRFGRFTRSFTMPRNVDPKSVDAKMDNGILKVNIKKSKDAVSRKIDVK